MMGVEASGFLACKKAALPRGNIRSDVGVGGGKAIVGS